MSWSRFFRRRRWHEERSRELAAYLDLETADNIARGMRAEDARFAARRKLGSPILIREEIYRMNTIGFVETLWQDLRHALRLMRLSPAFTVVAIASLALGIGANTAIFQLLDAVSWRTLPVPAARELATVSIADMRGARGSFQSPYPVLNNPLWERIRDRQQTFASMFAWANDGFDLSTSGESHTARGLWVSGGFFSSLGVQPVLGRVFQPSDDRRGCGSPGAVISYAFWRSEYALDPSIIGRKLTIAEHPFEIIGVTPASFFGLEIGHSYDVALPLCAEPIVHQKSQLDAGTTWWLNVMGRLKPGVSVEKASAHLTSISRGVFEATLPSNYPPENVKDYLGFRLIATPAAAGVSSLRDEYSGSLRLLLVIAALVLLIACANLANLMLARATARQREIAVRLAIGASRGRLIRQLLTESVLLAVVSAALGIFLARSLSQLLVAFLRTSDSTLSVPLQQDWRVLAFTAGLAVLTCLLFGLTPALRASGTEPGAAIKSRSSTANRERFGLQRVLVASQVALSLVLLVGALLFARSLENLVTLDPGFREDGIVIADIDFGKLQLPEMRINSFKDGTLDRLRAIPGVEAASDVNFLPVDDGSTSNIVWRQGADYQHGAESKFATVSEDYFKTLGIPMLAGREFNVRDSPSSAGVAIVNEAFARKLGLGANPVGARFRRERTPTEPERVFEIAGLVKNTKYLDIRGGFPPIAYLSRSQDLHPGAYMRILLRSNSPLSALTSEVKGVASALSPQIRLQFYGFKNMIRDGMLRERLLATLAGFFGLLAALLATIGLYGVMSYTVARRGNEIGIRMALGADRRQVTAMILREGSVLLAAGLAIGSVLALMAGQAASSLLFGLRPYDPLTLAAATALLSAVAVAASYFPARRAARLDPMVALREE